MILFCRRQLVDLLLGRHREKVIGDRVRYVGENRMLKKWRCNQTEGKKAMRQILGTHKLQNCPKKQEKNLGKNIN